MLTAASVNLHELFGAGGSLADCLADFAPRPEQLAMAEEVSDAIRDGHNLVVEAGTGTGKTLAYLIPALLSGQRVIISTGTRTLQDQLFHRDLPMVGRAMGRPVTVELLKGRANYLCLYRLDRFRDGFDGPESTQLSEFNSLQRWASRTSTGDIAELHDLPEGSPVWSRVTSTVDNCLGSRCPRFDDCHVIRARQQARDADLVVVNHHLLMADLTMKDEGFGELLPSVDAIVVDEAHHFPEVAQGFFNVSLGSGQIHNLVGDVRTEALREGLYDQDLEQILDGIRKASNDARLDLAKGVGSVVWAEAGADFSDSFAVIGDTISTLRDFLGEAGRSGVGIQRCLERAAAMVLAVDSLSDSADEEGLRWIQFGHQNFTANLTPLDAAAEIQALLGARPCTWIFTSATLAVRGDFGHFTRRLGIEDIATRQIPSPFAFAEISKLYLPAGLPAPEAPDYTEQVVHQMAEAVEASDGRAFLLFTSHRALKQAAGILEEKAEFDFPLLVQGTVPRSRLLEQFVRLSNAVLIGTATFWEGVDIRGHGLVLVAIDRLPFASPGDPMMAARLESIRSHGGNPFLDYQLPQAVLSLKQGVGRLIRDYSDYGVVMICDPRILQRRYGRVFLESLPPMPVTREIEDVRQFFSDRKRAD